MERHNFGGGFIDHQARQLSICTPQYPATRHLNFLPFLSRPIALISSIGIVHGDDDGSP